jgi:uncharacterized LabA/DUF88 family protein
MRRGAPVGQSTDQGVNVGKNVAVFVDVANIFYAAKAAGVDIDYVTLLKSAIAGRDFVRAYAYTGLDPDNENQRNFHNFLSRHDYKVVSKDIRKYGDGKVKANLDIELVVDMMKTARNLDVAIVVSGDGDFAPAIRAVQEMGVRVEVVSFRGNTSSDLIDVADQFTDIIQMAKVEKGSSRSGRRVADDGEDLSMTEVPDKLTEGTGRGRGRGVGRGRGRSGDTEREPVAARVASSRASRLESKPTSRTRPSRTRTSRSSPWRVRRVARDRAPSDRSGTPRSGSRDSHRRPGRLRSTSRTTTSRRSRSTSSPNSGGVPRPTGPAVVRPVATGADGVAPTRPRWTASATAGAAVAGSTAIRTSPDGRPAAAPAAGPAVGPAVGPPGPSGAAVANPAATIVRRPQVDRSASVRRSADRTSRGARSRRSSRRS